MSFSFQFFLAFEVFNDTSKNDAGVFVFGTKKDSQVNATPHGRLLGISRRVYKANMPIADDVIN